MRNVLPSLPYKNLNVLSISKKLHDYIVLNAYLVMYKYLAHVIKTTKFTNSESQCSID